VQKVLDPDPEIITTDGSISIFSLPGKARKFGFVPNWSKFLPGDLILFRSKSSNIFDQFVASAQTKAGVAQIHSQWTHAAISLYGDLIVEAVPRHGVRTRSLYDDIPGRIIRVRRAPNLTVTQRYEVALLGLQNLGQRYSALSALALGWRMRRGFWNWAAAPYLGPRIICSKLYSDTLFEVGGSRLAGCPVTDTITPAHLSFTSDLVDVDVGWLKVV